MGHRKFSAPKHGSLAFLPRGRARRIIARIRHWPEYTGKEPKLLGFAGYKAGTTHVIYIENKKTSPQYGQEITKVATVIEAPPMFVIGIRGYSKDINGYRLITEVLADPSTYPKELKLDRVLTLPKKENYNFEEKMAKFEENVEKFTQIRLLLATQPTIAGIHKKKPEILEYPIGAASIESALEYAKSKIGKTIVVNEVFSPGQFVDVIAITKGHGFQGPVKRWGIRILQHKSRKTKRGVGSIGPWHPARVMYTVPRAGQMGFHQRTEYNKIILKIGSSGEEITPKGGFPHYGVVKSNYILLLGTVPGPAKRLIRLRDAIRPPKSKYELPESRGEYQITYISLESKQ
ncbi:MAG: 50S ribosomal protein L3 [Candidatus Odinarchaeota archaeon]|nr:50S ribosomal protein L3 [Candidatus Odinarchaeota archaeon]